MKSGLDGFIHGVTPVPWRAGDGHNGNCREGRTIELGAIELAVPSGTL
ncbi:MAG: hypothetical protein HN609_08170 [Proteobacteria bacterium]|nr:hypothetical protein [Pseudomonadota bacterium]